MASDLSFSAERNCWHRSIVDEHDSIESIVFVVESENHQNEMLHHQARLIIALLDESCFQLKAQVPVALSELPPNSNC